MVRLEIAHDVFWHVSLWHDSLSVQFYDGGLDIARE